ncbi:hypothetical protein CREGCYN_13020 [Synechococcus sp. M16CYN]
MDRNYLQECYEPSVIESNVQPDTAVASVSACIRLEAEIAEVLYRAMKDLICSHLK